MNKMADKTFRFVTNNHRYIKQDGSGSFSGRLKSVFERAAFNVPLFVGACVGIGSMLLSEGNNGWESFLVNFLPFAVIGTVFGLKDQYFVLDKSSTQDDILKSQRGKAIDTTGTELSRASLSLSDLEMLRMKPIVQFTVFSISCLIAEGAFRLMFGNTFVGSQAGQACIAYWAGDSVSNSYIAHKLYKGHMGEENGYVFCAEQPKKPQTVKQSISEKIMGGIKSPSF